MIKFGNRGGGGEFKKLAYRDGGAGTRKIFEIGAGALKFPKCRSLKCVLSGHSASYRCVMIEKSSISLQRSALYFIKNREPIPGEIWRNFKYFFSWT